MNKLLLATVLLLGLAITYKSQVVCPHPDDIDMFENVAILPPLALKITYFDGTKISYVLMTNKQVRAGDLRIVPKTVIPKDFAQLFKKGKFWVVFCLTHRVIYRIDPYTGETAATK